MSGGSFNYLASQLTSDPLGASWEDMDSMINFLRSCEAEDAAADLAQFKAKLVQTEQELYEWAGKLNNVLHAAEWWQSSDWSEDQFRKAVEEYRTNSGQSK